MVVNQPKKKKYSRLVKKLLVNKYVDELGNYYVDESGNYYIDNEG